MDEAQRSLNPGALRVPAVVAAGDRRAAKAIHGQSKAVLELAGRPMVSHTVAALQSVPEITEVWVVGDARRLQAALSAPALQTQLRKPLFLVPQYRNLLQNVWQCYRRMLPGAGAEGRAPQNESEANMRVLYLSADLPFAQPREISAFLHRAAEADCAYALGLATEAALAPFTDDEFQPAYFNTRSGRLRQNNLHLVQPARLGNRQAVEEMYEHRHQKQLGQMLGLAWRILRRQGGGLRVMLYFALMQLALLADRLALRGVADWLRRALPLAKIENACSSLLQARFRLIVMNAAGCALDVDSETDLQSARARFHQWQALAAEQAQKESAGLPAAADAAPGNFQLQVLPPGPKAMEAGA